MISKLEASFIEKIIAHTVDGKITWRSYKPKKEDIINDELLREDLKSYVSNSLHYEERVMNTKTKTLVTKKMKCSFRIDHWYKNVRLICWFMNEDDYSISSFKIESSDEKSIEYRILNRLFIVAEDSNSKKVEADKVANITSFISNFK